METLACWLIAWTAMAVVGYLIGNPKGRGAMGAALGFFLGPVGVLAAIFIGPDQAKAERDMRAKLEMEARLRHEMGLPGGAPVPVALEPEVSEAVRTLAAKQAAQKQLVGRAAGLLIVLALAGLAAAIYAPR